MKGSDDIAVGLIVWFYRLAGLYLMSLIIAVIIYLISGWPLGHVFLAAAGMVVAGGVVACLAAIFTREVSMPLWIGATVVSSVYSGWPMATWVQG